MLPTGHCAPAPLSATPLSVLVTPPVTVAFTPRYSSLHAVPTSALEKKTNQPLSENSQGIVQFFPFLHRRIYPLQLLSQAHGNKSVMTLHHSLSRTVKSAHPHFSPTENWRQRHLHEIPAQHHTHVHGPTPKAEADLLHFYFPLRHTPA
ncbi:exo-alpha-sialidase [Trypanosoma cruzi]|nr:exo-alpha-sialidase [Trypanosoma cruzi]